MTPVDAIAAMLRLVSPADGAGAVRIPSPTPLTRLNYYDGKYLRAPDMTLEQAWVRSLVELSNQAGGAGVAHGLDTTLGTDDTLRVGAGLAVDPAGRLLLLPGPVSTGIADLIARSRRPDRPVEASRTGGSGFGDCLLDDAPPADVVVSGDELYVVTIGHAEALCGEEDVYGTPCESACVTTTDRPYRLEGVVLRADPLRLRTPLATSRTETLTRTHLRSLVASAAFADERSALASLISGAGLRSPAWCLGADAAGGTAVPLAVIGRAGSQTLFLDVWTVRRERMEPPARRHWAFRMAMRPWDVFLAQVLQFQCQLRTVIDDPAAGRATAVGDLLGEAGRFLGDLGERLRPVMAARRGVAPDLPGGLDSLRDLGDRLSAASTATATRTGRRVLIRGGIVELPSAGYLPVTPGPLSSVNDQVTALLGEGVDLRFRVTSPDVVPHALEEAQHMERIPLLSGLDDPAARPPVDVLVPDGRIVGGTPPRSGEGWRAVLHLGSVGRSKGAMLMEEPVSSALPVRGAGRSAAGPQGGLSVYFAGAAEAQADRVATALRPLAFVGSRDARHFTAAVRLAEREGRAADATPSHGELRRVTALGVEADRASSAPPEEAADAPIVAETAVGRVTAVWLQASTDRNVLGMEVGDTARLDLSVVVVSPSASALMNFRGELGGELRVTARRADAMGVHVEGRVSALGRAEQIPTPEGASGDPVALEMEVSLDLDTSVTPHLLTVAAAHDGTALFEWSTAWTATGIPEGTSRLAFDGSRLRYAAEARRDDGVLAAGHPLHTLAVSALRLVGNAISDAGFAAAKERLLFPPQAAPTGAKVEATRDWVLFHRRRTITDTPAPDETPVPRTLAYALWHGHTRDAGDAAAILKRVAAGDQATVARRLRLAGTVTFPALGATPLTTGAELRETWRRAGADGDVGPTLVATGPDPADLAAAPDRARAMLAELDALTPFDPASADIVAQAQVPPPLVVGGADGAMVVMTVDAPARRTCHVVYRVSGADDAEDAVRRAILEGGLVRYLAGQERTRLARVVFAADGSDVVEGGDELRAAWPGAPPGNWVLVVSRAGDALAGDREARTRRAAEITRLLGNEFLRIPTMEIEEEVPECPAVTLVYG